MPDKDTSKVAAAAKVYFDAARQTPREMFAPWVAFLGAAKDIATGVTPRKGVEKSQVGSETPPSLKR